MAQFEQWFDQDFTEKIEIRHCESVMFTGDDKGSVVGVRLYNSGAPYSGGGTATGAVKRSDGGVVGLTGMLNGNAASVVIPSAALACPGPIGICIILTQGGSIATVLKAIYTVDDNTGTPVDPGTIIPSVNDLINAVENAVASIPSDYSALLASLAPTFSASMAYAAGNYVWYSGALYRFTADHAAGTWNGKDAVKAIVGNDMSFAIGGQFPVAGVTFSRNGYAITSSAAETGRGIATNGLGANTSLTDLINVEGYDQVAITMRKQTGTANAAGLAFYSFTEWPSGVDATTGAAMIRAAYISGVRENGGASALTSERRYITIPKGAKTMRSTWFASTEAEYSSRTFSCTLIKKGAFDAANENLSRESGTLGIISPIWERGGFYESNGQPYGNDIRIRTANAYAVTPGDTLSFVLPETGEMLYVFGYGTDDLTDYKGMSSVIRDGGTYTVPSDVAFVRFLLAASGNPNIDASYGKTAVVYNQNGSVQTLIRDAAKTISFGPLLYIEGTGKHLIRSDWDDTNDMVTAFHFPETTYSNTFNLADCRLIPKTTADTDTESAYDKAAVYKDCHDDIAPLRINGYFIGANHGNPNFTLVYATHDKTAADIGSVWTDGTNDYTLVYIGPAGIVMGSLNENGELTSRTTAATLSHKSGATHTANIAATRMTAYQPRHAALNITGIITDENGRPMSSGLRANKIRFTEQYDIADQSKMLAYLQKNVGKNTNTSYYSNNITDHMGTVRNVYEFQRHGAFIVNAAFTAKESLTLNYWFGTQSCNWATSGEYYGYVPGSVEADSIFKLPTSATTTLHGGGSYPYRYYQLIPDHTKGYFTHIIPVGDSKIENRVSDTEAGHYAYGSGAEMKQYPRAIKYKSMTSGDTVQVHAARGPMAKPDSAYACTVCAWYWDDLGAVLAIDYHETGAFAETLPLPAYFAGMKAAVIDNGGLATDDYVGAHGIKVKGIGHCWAVLRLTASGDNARYRTYEIGTAFTNKYLNRNTMRAVNVGTGDTASDISDFIPVETGKTYIFNNLFVTGSRAMLAYNASGQPVAVAMNGDYQNGAPLTVSDSTWAYLRASVASGKHLLVSTDAEMAAADDDIHARDCQAEFAGVGYILSNGNISISESSQENLQMVPSNYIPVLPGTLLEIRGFVCTTSNKVICAFYDANRTFISPAQTDEALYTAATYVSYVVTVPANAHYVRFTTNRGFMASGVCGAYYVMPQLKIAKPAFVRQRAGHGPMITLIDDDTVDLNQVQDFHKVCVDNGFVGTFAVIPSYIVGGFESPSATKKVDPTIGTRLLEYEREGFQPVIHCHEQLSYFLPANRTENPELLKKAEANLVKGLQEMQSLGFTNFHYWVTPYGASDTDMRNLARKWGMKCLVSITQPRMQHIDPADRWYIPRMELYPPNPNAATPSAGNTLTSIKAMIDACAEDNGWLLVGVHCNTWHNDYNNTSKDTYADGDDASFRARFADLYELLEHAREKGLKPVTLAEGFSHWEPVFNWYDQQ